MLFLSASPFICPRKVSVRTKTEVHTLQHFMCLAHQQLCKLYLLHRFPETYLSCSVLKAFAQMQESIVNVILMLNLD